MKLHTGCQTEVISFFEEIKHLEEKIFVYNFLILPQRFTDILSVEIDFITNYKFQWSSMSEDIFGIVTNENITYLSLFPKFRYFFNRHSIISS